MNAEKKAQKERIGRGVLGALLGSRPILARAHIKVIPEPHHMQRRHRCRHRCEQRENHHKKVLKGPAPSIRAASSSS